MSTNTKDQTAVVPTESTESSQSIPAVLAGVVVKSSPTTTKVDTRSALTKAWQAGKALTADQVTAVLSDLRNVSDLAINGDQAIRTADDATTEARKVADALRADAEVLRGKVGEARVTFARGVLLLTTTRVVPVKSMTGKDLAAALGVSTAYVSQVATNAGAMLTMVGPVQWSPAMYGDVDVARRRGADTLKTLVASAVETATKRAQAESAKSTDAKSTPIRATATEVRAIRQEIAATKDESERAANVADPADVLVKRLQSALDQFGKVTTVSDDQRAKVTATLAAITRAVAAL